jgi:site-specific DNA-methyltransferase (adenine-specific)
MMDELVNKIIEGDALKILPQIPTGGIDLVVVDPPYYTAHSEFIDSTIQSFDNYLEWYKKWVVEVWRVLKEDGSLYVFIPPLEFAEIHLLIRECFCQKQIISWIKPNVMIRQPTARNYLPKVEFVGFYTKDPKKYIWNSLAKKYGLQKACNFAIEPTIHRRVKEGTEHPTQKPLRLCAKFIYASSNENDIVLDLFCGSGTTCAAARKLSRKFVGIEISSKYCRISRQRVEQFSINDLGDKPRGAIF